MPTVIRHRDTHQVVNVAPDSLFDNVTGRSQQRREERAALLESLVAPYGKDDKGYFYNTVEVAPETAYHFQSYDWLIGKNVDDNGGVYNYNNLSTDSGTIKERREYWYNWLRREFEPFPLFDLERIDVGTALTGITAAAGGSFTMLNGLTPGRAVNTLGRVIMLDRAIHNDDNLTDTFKLRVRTWVDTKGTSDTADDEVKREGDPSRKTETLDYSRDNFAIDTLVWDYIKSQIDIPIKKFYNDYADNSDWTDAFTVATASVPAYAAFYTVDTDGGTRDDTAAKTGNVELRNLVIKMTPTDTNHTFASSLLAFR